MTDARANNIDRYDGLVRSLAADLVPVKPLRGPVLRALGWLAVVAAIAFALAPFSDTSAMTHRLEAATDLWLAALGSTLTAILASIAAFELSLPDRSPKWALLPVPAALLWIGASGLGCMRAWFVAGTHDATSAEELSCVLLILGLSIPLSVLLIVMLRRAHSLWPNLTGAMGGLAVAGASATLLNLFHPHDAAATDLTVHVVAVAIVIVANWTLAGRRLVDRT